MPNHACKVVTALALACATIAPPNARAQDQPKPQLTLALQPGQTARFGFFEVEALTNQAETIRGGVATNIYLTDAQVLFRALDQTPEALTVEMTYERVKFQVESPVIKEPPAFDTAAPLAEALENPLAPALLAVVNKPIILRLAKSGRIERVESPDINIPDVRYSGVAQQMLTHEWIVPRFQPVFSLSAPEPDGPTKPWSLVSEIPLGHGLSQRLRVHVINSPDAPKGGFANINMNATAEILPYEGTERTNPQNFKFTGSGNASWNTTEGLLAKWSLKHDWSFDALPQANLPMHVDSSVHIIIARLN